MISCRQGLLAAVGVCLLAGCGGGGDSGGQPLPPIISTSPTAATTASPTAPAVAVSPFPATPQGARDFAHYLFAQIDRAYATKDPELVRPLFAEGCVACGNYLHTLEQVQRGALTVAGGDAVVLSAETPGGVPAGEAVVDVRVSYSDAVLTKPDGTRTTEPAAVASSLVSLRTTPTSYIVTEIRLSAEAGQ